VSSKPRTTGRPPRISRQAIVEAARRIVDADGLERLTMRRLADEIGSAPMALYHHVRNKDDLLVLLMEDFAATMRRPRLPADPRQRIVTIFATLHDNFARCPWIVEVLTTDDLMNEEALWYVDHVIGALTDAGLTPPQAVHAYRTLWYYTAGEIIIRTTAERRRTTSDRPSLRDRIFGQIDPDQYPRLASVAHDWADLTARDTYRDGLEALLAGLLPLAPSDR
jgi:AcrR family transcriptional regulator